MLAAIIKNYFMKKGVHTPCIPVQTSEEQEECMGGGGADFD